MFYYILTRDNCVCYTNFPHCQIINTLFKGICKVTNAHKKNVRFMRSFAQTNIIC